MTWQRSVERWRRAPSAANASPRAPSDVAPHGAPHGRAELFDRALFLAWAGIVLVRLTFCLTLAATAGDPTKFFTPDSSGYLLLASQPSLFLRGLESHSLIRTPGYPMFLWLMFALLGHSPLAWTVPQALLCCGTSGVIVAGLRNLLPERLRAGAWIAGILALLDLTGALISLQVLTETLFTFLFVSGALLWTLAWKRNRPIFSVVAGLLLGLALLVRPVLMLFGLVALVTTLLVPLFRMRVRTLHAFLFAIGLGTPVLGWMANNHHRSGHVFLSTLDGVQLYGYRAVPTLALATGTSEAAADEELRVRRDASLVHPEDPFEVRQAEFRVAAQILKSYPMAFLRITALGSLRMLFGPGIADIDRWLAGARAAVYWVVAYLSGIYLLCCVGISSLWRLRAWPALAACTVPLAYLIAVSSGGESYSRFRVPWLPLACACAGVGVADLGRSRTVGRMVQRTFQMRRRGDRSCRSSRE